MPSNRPQWANKFAKLPRWDCPTCGKGRLLTTEDKIRKVETGPSKRAHGDPDWDPEWVEYRFVTLLKCDFASCGEIVAVAGSVSVQEDVEQDDEGEWVQAYLEPYHVRAVEPAPNPIRFAEGTPKAVKSAVASAASLIWMNAEASANQIRQAVEHLMDAKKIKKVVTNSGKQTKLTLHARIEASQKIDKENGDILLAIKWLGNSGSHPGAITRGDVLDAFDMLELVLDNLYGTTKATIMKKVRAVNKKKGPANLP